MARNVRRSLTESRGVATGLKRLIAGDIRERAKELDWKRTLIVWCAPATHNTMATGRLRRLAFDRMLITGSWRSPR